MTLVLSGARVGQENQIRKQGRTESAQVREEGKDKRRFNQGFEIQVTRSASDCVSERVSQRPEGREEVIAVSSGFAVRIAISGGTTAQIVMCVCVRV